MHISWGWAHRQRVSTTFLTRKNSHQLFLCSWREYIRINLIPRLFTQVNTFPLCDNIFANILIGSHKIMKNILKFSIQQFLNQDFSIFKWKWKAFAHGIVNIQGHAHKVTTFNSENLSCTSECEWFCNLSLSVWTHLFITTDLFLIQYSGNKCN